MAYHPFPPTRWTLVLSARDGNGSTPSEALEHLAWAYWKPVYAYQRGSGRSHEEAQDETQGFFAYLLARDFLKNVQPEGGRFRNFLLVLFRRWLRDERNPIINVKREAEVTLQPWHEIEADDMIVSNLASATPEKAFDRQWVETLVTRSMAVLEDSWKSRAELRDTVESPGNVGKYAAIAGRLDMTEGAVGKAAHDLRQQFAQQLRQEVADTVARDEDVEGELRYLVPLMSPLIEAEM